MHNVTEIAPPPRVNLADIEKLITKVEYHVYAGRLTLCIIHLRNGFLCTGISACADVRTFDKKIGEEMAYSDAIDKAWAVEGYLLMERMYRARHPE